MTVTSTPVLATGRRPTAAQRFGYILAIVLNGVGLWAAHRLLDWGWPVFLTGAFEEVLPVLTASFLVTMAVNTAFLVIDRGRFRAFADLVTAAVALVVTARMWTVFPFDFADQARDWSWLLRLVLAAGIIGTVVAIVVQTARLVSGEAGPAAPRTPVRRRAP